MRRLFAFAVLSLAAPCVSYGQAAPKAFTHADTLRGTNGPARAWWDASFYDLHVTVSPADSSIRGWNAITYRIIKPATQMQIDLQPPLAVDSIVQQRSHLTYRRDGNALFVTLRAPQRAATNETVTVYYHGKPVAARRPPWDGGFIWQHDSLGSRWISTANEGLGASVWWPVKDLLSDEPDSQRIAITVPDPMIDVSNGRLRSVVHHTNATSTFEWFVTKPINTYDVEVNAGDYTHLADIYHGEDGTLTLDYWPLAFHADTARIHFAQVKPMLKCFEHWFGPYPWYADGYKLIEAPHLGMEHQSGVAYGNGFKNGYLGRDLSGTGWGLKWDFIIVHESAHEWWGNSITMKDQADMWIHEAFANYAEGLYAECEDGKQAGDEYIIGNRRNVVNDKPIIAPYGVNAEGSEDMYYKGGNMLHTMRQIVNDDARWRDVLRGIQSIFRHQTVTGAQIEQYINQRSGIDFSKVFQQYLTTTMIPTLEYKNDNGRLSYRWTNVVPGFAMPVKAGIGDTASFPFLHPTQTWQVFPSIVSPSDSLLVNPNFYVVAKRGR